MPAGAAPRPVADDGRSSDPRAGDVRRVGRYAIFDEIASGGMAAVHLGRLEGPVGFSRTVAIKRLHPHLARDPEFLAMFLDEARLAARVRHPNVVATLDVVADAGEVLLVLEYVTGASLWRLARVARETKQPIPIGIASGILAGVLAGLHAAHEATREDGAPLSIVHRDVSPQNVLVGTDGVARVLDFGIAKAAYSSVTTRDGQMKGKLSYMAPEQVRAAVLDRRADVYAAAVVLWETLTSERMHAGDNPLAVMRAISDDVPVAPSSLRPDVSPELDEVCRRGLAKDADDRWATARDMARALELAAPPATARAIGEWVEATASDELARLADLAARVEGRRTAHAVTKSSESGPGTAVTRPSQVGTAIVAQAGPPPSEATTAPEKPVPPAREIDAGELEVQRPPGRSSVTLLAVVLLAGAAIVLALRRGSPPAEPDGIEQRTEGAPRPTETSVTSAPTTESSRADPAVAPSPASSASASSSASAVPKASVTPPIVSSHARPSVTSAPSAQRTAPASRPECSPPYVMRDGIKRYKPECL